MYSKLKPKNIMWHYSESGHGKGAPDGVGGLLKRTADGIVARVTDIADVSTLITKLKEHCQGNRILPFDENVLQEVEEAKPTDIQVFKGTAQIHQLTRSFTSPYLFARRLTCITCELDQECPHYGLGIIKLLDQKTTNHNAGRLHYSEVYSTGDESDDEDETSNVGPNEYVVVKFDGKKTIYHYVGLVTKEEENDELLVKFLKRSAGTFFVFPEIEDLCPVQRSDVVAKLEQPLVNNRQQYKAGKFSLSDSLTKLLL